MPEATVKNQTHSEYDVALPVWTKSRDARKGEDAVKLKGEAYLPKLQGQEPDQYKAYLMRGRFFNAFAKTIDGHIGLATRKETIIEAPESMEKLLDNVDRQGSGMQDYIKAVLREVLEVNRAGTLVDYSIVPEKSTAAEAKKIGARPYLILYKAEDIRDWEYDENNKLIYVLLRERIPTRGNRVVGGKEYRYRECEILNGVYTQILWEDGSDVAINTIVPRMNNQSLNFIPFTIHQDEFDQQVSQPVLIDLVNLCFSYYRLKADHAHALHYVALPTPWITGVEEDKAPKTIGPEKVWAITNPDAKVGMLEFTGEGVLAIQNELRSMEDQMAVLGSRVLMPEVAEHTATASKINSISETSDLATIVLTEEKQMNWILAFYAQWAGAVSVGVEDQTNVDMPTDFMPTTMDAQMITAMVGAWQNGAFDWNTLIQNFQKAELVDADVDLDELKKAIEDEDETRMVNAAKAIAASVAANPTEDDDTGTGSTDGA